MPPSFREDFLNVFCPIGMKWGNLIEDLPYMLHVKFSFIWPSSFRGNDFRNRPTRNKNCLWWPCLFTDQDKMSNLYRGPSTDASCQVSAHFAMRVQRRRFKYEKLTDNRQRKMDPKWWRKLTWPLARWANNFFSNQDSCIKLEWFL